MSKKPLWRTILDLLYGAIIAGPVVALAVLVPPLYLWLILSVAVVAVGRAIDRELGALRAALRGLRRGSCWCDNADPYPLMQQHSPECDAARVVLKEFKPIAWRRH